MLHHVTPEGWFKLPLKVRQRWWRETDYGRLEPSEELKAAMGTAFDPLRAAREELAGLADVQRALTRREQIAEEAMSLAETELNAIRKINGYVRITVAAIQQRIAELEREREAPTP